jgi:hypothetical protein
MLAAGLTSSYGVEIDAIKCQKAAAFLAQTRMELTRRGATPPWFTAVPEVSCSAIEQASIQPGCQAVSRLGVCDKSADVGLERLEPAACWPTSHALYEA